MIVTHSFAYFNLHFYTISAQMRWQVDFDRSSEAKIVLLNEQML